MTSRNVRRWRQNYNFETFTVKTRCIILRTKVERGWLLRAFSGRMFLCFSHSGIFEVISGTRKGNLGGLTDSCFMLVMKGAGSGFCVLFG